MNENIQCLIKPFTVGILISFVVLFLIFLIHSLIFFWFEKKININNIIFGGIILALGVFTIILLIIGNKISQSSEENTMMYSSGEVSPPSSSPPSSSPPSSSPPSSSPPSSSPPSSSPPSSSPPSSSPPPPPPSGAPPEAQLAKEEEESEKKTDNKIMFCPPDSDEIYAEDPRQPVTNSKHDPKEIRKIVEKNLEKDKKNNRGMFRSS